mmetsp:Transcript_27546/g.49677  ORF Transcript_27546/g.49677 Transcript_27546/m.49677 type:complete len:117 (+) Transcript_27546:1626-1976(+)
MMSYYTDITDWCFAECFNSQMRYPLTQDDVRIMYSKSPISKAAGVNCSSLIVVGNSDIRVPDANSIEWYRVLKALGKPVTMICFPSDDHGIETPSSAFEHSAYTLAWLASVLKPQA